MDPERKAQITQTLASLSWQDIIIILVIAVLTRWCYWNLLQPFFSPLRKVPGKTFKPIIGNMFEVSKAEAMTTAIRWLQELKSLTIRMYYYGGRERLVTADPKYFRHIFVTNVNNYERVTPASNLINLMGKALFFLSGQQHHSVRKLLNPAFGILLLEEAIPVFQSEARQVAAIWDKMLDQSEGLKSLRVPVQHFMTRIALDSICVTGFDFNPNAVSNPETSGVKKLEKYLTGLSVGNFFRNTVPLLNILPTKSNRERWSQEAYIKTLINKAIQEKREQYATTHGQTGERPPRDLLSLLVLASDEQGNNIPQDLVFENVAGFLFAGFDTTSITMTWLLLQLATHPNIQSRVREEILREIPNESLPLSHEVLDRLKYLACVIKETQRLFPVVSSTTRRALEDDVIDGQSIPAGTTITLHIGALHRMPENWDDPEEFRPERFQQEVPPYKHMPFITGPYMCIGHKFALFEIKTVMVTLLRKFEFSLIPEFKFRRIQSLSVKPHPSLELFVSRVGKK